MPKKAHSSVIPIERIAQAIYLIRGEKVMLDQDLAALYGVETGALVRSMKRNIDRFPQDFAFQLTKDEFEDLRCQFGTSSQWGGRRYPPYAFTEQGVAMLSSVVRSKQAILVNVNIMRTFVRMREILATHKDLARKVEKHDKEIAALYAYLQQLLEPPRAPTRKIGYRRDPA